MQAEWPQKRLSDFVPRESALNSWKYGSLSGTNNENGGKVYQKRESSSYLRLISDVAGRKSGCRQFYNKLNISTLKNASAHFESFKWPKCASVLLIIWLSIHSNFTMHRLFHKYMENLFINILLTESTFFRKLQTDWKLFYMENRIEESIFFHHWIKKLAEIICHTKLFRISGKIERMRENNDGGTGVQWLMRTFDESLADAKVQGNER